MRADFVNEVARVLKIGRRDLIEKDLILHQILTDLSQDNFFSDNFLFKGGTCLIKCYFGYVRFSEDIDFTWKDQSAFNEMSRKKIRVTIIQDHRQDWRCFRSHRQEKKTRFQVREEQHGLR